MPVKPENLPLYPDDWADIALAVKEAAGWRCQCAGECAGDPGHLDTDDGRCVNRHHGQAYGNGKRVILTTAHLNHDPADCSPGNLAAYCAPCHLRYDREHHARTRAATLAARRAAAQMELLTDDH